MAKHRDLAAVMYARTLGSTSASKIWRTVVFAGAMLAAGCGGGSKQTAPAQPTEQPAATEATDDKAAADAAAKEEADRKAAEAAAMEAEKKAAEERAAKEEADRKAAEELAAKQAAEQAAAEEAAKKKPRPRGGGKTRPTGRGFILS